MSDKNRSFDWFHDAQERGVYNKKFTLKDWAHEIEWRLRYKKMIDEDRIGQYVSEWVSFLELLNNPQGRFNSNFSFASKISDSIRTPIFNKSDEHQLRVDEIINHEEGLVAPLFVNLSYDDKTLVDNFNNWLIDWKKETTKRNEQSQTINRREKGFIALTEEDAVNWNKHHILECIDYDLWQRMTGDYFNYLNGGDEAFAKTIGVLPSDLRQTSLKKSRYIFNTRFLGQIKASLHGSEK